MGSAKCEGQSPENDELFHGSHPLNDKRNFAKLLGLVRGTVEAAGKQLLAFHFLEHTRSHVHILRMFTQFAPAVLDRLYFGAGGGLDCGNQKSLHRHHGGCQKNRKNRVPKHSLKGGPFFHGPSLAGGGVDYGLMSFNRFSRSASYDCEGKGDENERVFHGRIPSLTV